MCFVFELAYKLNISVNGHNCRNSCDQIAYQELPLSAYGVRYFLGQYMRPFKLYQFFDEINQQICSSKGKKTLSLNLDNY